jgi:hypothetical protein
VVAKVVLAELAGGVAEIVQEFGERRSAGPQIGRATGQLRRDQARAQRIHAGEEGVAAGSAALHGDIVHEDRTLLSNPVDVGRFPHHQAAMVDSRLHKANVVAHDEENVGLFIRSCLFGGCLRLWLLICLRLRGAGGEDNTGGKSAEDGVEVTAHDRGPFFKRDFFGIVF